jgi:mRNA interferase MazF
MGTFTGGQIVVLPFPFSDLSRHKYRPALLLASVGKGDWLACQITSNPYADPLSICITDGDFSVGTLTRDSYVRPGKIFTANESLFAGVAGTLKPAKYLEVRDTVIELLRSAE